MTSEFSNFRIKEINIYTPTCATTHTPSSGRGLSSLELLLLTFILQLNNFLFGVLSHQKPQHNCFRSMLSPHTSTLLLKSINANSMMSLASSPSSLAWPPQSWTLTSSWASATPPSSSPCSSHLAVIISQKKDAAPSGCNVLSTLLSLAKSNSFFRCHSSC